MRRVIPGAVLPLCLMLTACQASDRTSLYLEETAFSEEDTTIQNEEVQQALEEKSIYVHVCGAVNTPGVYELKDGARGFEAVDEADGFSEDASKDSVNLAQQLCDGQMLYIPTMEMAQQQKLQEEKDALGLVNINTADKKELMELPGIGEARAEAILRYREERGAFQNPEALKEVDGIKESVYEKLKNLITIE